MPKLWARGINTERGIELAEVKWIKIVTDIFDDEKILLIEQMPEADSIIVIWFKILTLAGKTNNSGVLMFNNKIPYTNEMLSTIFRRPLNIIRLALKTFEEFEMIEVFNNTITIPNWSKHQSLEQMEQRKEYMKNYMREYREKQKLLIECKPNSKPNGKVNVNEADIDKELELDIDNIYSDLFSHWTSQKELIQHREMTNEHKKAMKYALKRNSKEEIIIAITRLATVIADENYYYKHKWSLDNFLKQSNGYKNWLDDGQYWVNYIEQRGKEVGTHWKSTTEKNSEAKKDYSYLVNS